MTDSSLITAFENAARTHAGRIALRGEHHSLTYALLHEQARALAERMRYMGASKDEPVLVMSSNHPLDFVALVAVWIAGAVAVPVHRSAPPAVVDAVQCKAAAQFAVDCLQPNAQIRALAPVQLPQNEQESRAAMLRGAALVIFTSGSTGLPKGVVLSHRAFGGKLFENQRILQFGDQDSTLLVLNNTFSFGIWMAMLTLHHGATLVTRERFDSQTFLDTLVSEKITRVGVVPTMIRATFGTMTPSVLARASTELRAAKTLRDMIIGGEPLGLALSVSLRELIAPAALYDVYGLTETSTSDFVLAPNDYPAHPNTIGKPAAQVRFRITNDGTNACSPDVPGELQLQTPFLMNGYLGDEALTKAAQQNGWFRTGDMASSDAHGFVTIVGRIKELIVRGGNKITPFEVERALCDCHGVAAALVAGLPDPILGQRIYALLVPKTNEHLNAASLRAELGNRLEKFKFPDFCFVGAALPTGRTGKIDRGQLQVLLGTGALPKLASWSD